MSPRTATTSIRSHPTTPKARIRHPRATTVRPCSRRRPSGLYLEAQDLLREGDLAGYEEKLDQVGDLLAQLAEELNNDG